MFLQKHYLKTVKKSLNLNTLLYFPFTAYNEVTLQKLFKPYAINILKNSPYDYHEYLQKIELQKRILQDHQNFHKGSPISKFLLLKSYSYFEKTQVLKPDMILDKHTFKQTVSSLVQSKSELLEEFDETCFNLYNQHKEQISLADICRVLKMMKDLNSLTNMQSLTFNYIDLLNSKEVEKIPSRYVVHLSFVYLEIIKSNNEFIFNQNYLNQFRKILVENADDLHLNQIFMIIKQINRIINYHQRSKIYFLSFVEKIQENLIHKLQYENLLSDSEKKIVNSPDFCLEIIRLFKFLGLHDSQIFQFIEDRLINFPKQNPFKTFLISFNMLSVIKKGDNLLNSVEEKISSDLLFRKKVKSEIQEYNTNYLINLCYNMILLETQQKYQNMEQFDQEQNYTYIDQQQFNEIFNKNPLKNHQLKLFQLVLQSLQRRNLQNKKNYLKNNAQTYLYRINLLIPSLQEKYDFLTHFNVNTQPPQINPKKQIKEDQILQNSQLVNDNSQEQQQQQDQVVNKENQVIAKTNELNSDVLQILTKNNIEYEQEVKLLDRHCDIYIKNFGEGKTNIIIELDGRFHYTPMNHQQSSASNQMRNTLFMSQSYKILEINYINWEIQRCANTMEEYLLNKIKQLSENDILYIR